MRSQLKNERGNFFFSCNGRHITCAGVKKLELNCSWYTLLYQSLMGISCSKAEISTTWLTKTSFTSWVLRQNPEDRINRKVWDQKLTIRLKNDFSINYPSQDSSIGSISACYRRGPGFRSRQGQKIFQWN